CPRRPSRRQRPWPRQGWVVAGRGFTTDLRSPFFEFGWISPRWGSRVVPGATGEECPIAHSDPLHAPSRLYQSKSGRIVHGEGEIRARTFQSRDAVPVPVFQARPIAASHSGSPDLTGDGIHVRDKGVAVDGTTVISPIRHRRAVFRNHRPTGVGADSIL